MRTISILRWVNGLRALTPGLTTTAPASSRSGGAATLTPPAPGTTPVLAAPGGATSPAGHSAWPPVPFRSRPPHGPYGDESAGSAGLPHEPTPVPTSGPHTAPAVQDRVKSPNSAFLKRNSPVRGRGLAIGDGNARTSSAGVTGHPDGPTEGVRGSSRPAAPATAVVPDGTRQPAPRPAGTPLPVFLHGARPAL